MRHCRAPPHVLRLYCAGLSLQGVHGPPVHKMRGGRGEAGQGA